MRSGLPSRKGNLFISTLVSSSLFWTNKNKTATIPNRPVYVIGAPWRDNWVTKEEGFVAGATACPAAAGTPAWCHGFCQRENKLITIITLHRTTSAKTRATPTRRQQHIPPNVRANSGSCNWRCSYVRLSHLHGGPAEHLAAKWLANAPELRLIATNRILSTSPERLAKHPNSAVGLRFSGCVAVYWVEKETCSSVLK